MDIIYKPVKSPEKKSSVFLLSRHIKITQRFLPFLQEMTNKKDTLKIVLVFPE